MRDLDLTTLRLFVYVCETGSMMRAGERANVVPSAISKRLMQLEDRLGTRLLARKGYGVAPTAAGHALLEHARAVLESTSRIERDMRSFAAGAQGHVRILASASAMAESLAAHVVDFLDQPASRSIQIDLEERMTPEIVRGVQEGLASLGICWDAADLGDLQHRPYCTDTLCVVVPMGHPLASRRKVRFADTLGYLHVGLPFNSATERKFQQLKAEFGTDVRHRVVVTSFQTALQVVRTRAAITVAPREIAEPVAQAYQLKLLTLDESWAHRQFVVCFRSTEALTPAAKLLLDFLTATDASASSSDAQKR